MMRIVAVLLALLTWLATSAVPVQAQLGNYTSPGTTTDRPEDERLLLDQQLETALWKVGPVRLDPWIGVTDAAFVSNVFTASSDEDEYNDFTMTVGAGVQGIVPFGSKVFLTFDAVPQYVIWTDRDERNGANQWFGSRLSGFYNRLYLEAAVERRDRVRVISSEVNQPINQRRDVLEGLAEVAAGNSFHIFVAGRLEERTNREEDPPFTSFSALDREETLARAGLRYRPRQDVMLGLGLESAETEFLSEEKDMSNSGEYPFLELQYDAPTFFLTGSVSFLDLEPTDELSLFPALDDEQWRLQLTLNPGWRLEYTLYGRDAIQYALDSRWAYYSASRYGGRINATLSERWQSSLFLETGLDDYVELAEGPAREDDVVSWGISVTVAVTERFSMRFGYRQTSYDSTIPGRDRDNGQIVLDFGVEALALGRR